MSSKSKTFYEGYRDFTFGKTNNPYEEDTIEHEEWQLGYDTAEDDEYVLVYNAARRCLQRGRLADDT